MSLLFDSFWRAVAYCVHPRVIALSFLPLVMMVLLSFGLGYFFWEGAVASVTAWLESYSLVQTFLAWLEGIGLGALRTVFGPLLVLVLATPMIVLLCLLLVAMFMTPTMVTRDPERLRALHRPLEPERVGLIVYDQDGLLDELRVDLRD